MVERRRGPMRLRVPRHGDRTIGVHIWQDTALALETFAADHGLYVSGAAHVLLRQALNLPPIPESTDTN